MARYDIERGSTDIAQSGGPDHPELAFPNYLKNCFFLGKKKKKMKTPAPTAV